MRKLERAGALLRAGDAASVASLEALLGSSSGDDRWLPELKAAAAELARGKGADAAATERALFEGIAGLQAAAKKGDVPAARLEWLSAVSGLEYFARAVGVQKEITGL